MNTTTRTIDPDLMNLHGELPTVAPFEDLARYSLTSLAPMAFADDATGATLPPLPMERTSTFARRAAAVSFIALAALGGVNIGMKLAAWSSANAMHAAAAPAALEMARELAPTAAAPKDEQAAPREQVAPSAQVAQAAEEKVFVLPTVEIVGSLRQARAMSAAAMRDQDRDDASKDDAKDALAQKDDASKDDAMDAVAKDDGKDAVAKDDASKNDAMDAVAKDDAPPSDFAAPSDPRAALAELPGDLDRAAAAIAIASAARTAASCLDAGDGSTTMPVRVTFAPSGRVTSAIIVGGPFVGSPVGGCIAGALRSAGVGAFTGSAVTVTTTIRVR